MATEELTPKAPITFTRNFWWAMALCVFAITSDQWSKIAAIDTVIAHGSAIEITSFFNLVMAWNTGVSFSMFADYDARWVLSALATLLAMVMFAWLVREQEDRLQSLALGAIIGGAIGNVIDRVRLGAVADFLDFHAMGYHWPAFNLADCFIVCGVMCLVWRSFFPYEPDENSHSIT